ncbi:MAG: ABC-F family ATP-binding cassette domain-containing protein [Bacteroidales bacterium]|nr:ABC-F family ATP-binding cassette domain-containing protein [Bacteroidales bacterium]
MNLLSVENLSKSYGERLLFDKVSFGLEKGQKTALVAKNGTGKSTLLNILAGLDLPDEGRVILRKDTRIAYLPQANEAGAGDSVLDFLLDSNTPLIAAVREYTRCTEAFRLQATEANRQAMERSWETMDRLQAWNAENEIREVLSRFRITDLFAPLSRLSGGERKKAALAKTLLSDAELWILDEPTNHLDIQMIEWLEAFLAAADKTLLLVTHDRFFLDKVCDDILELDQTKMYKYKGDYAYFLEKKAERAANREAEWERYRQWYRQELKWIHASVQARGTKAKARKDHFEKLKDRVMVERPEDEAAFSVQAGRIGNKILEVHNVDFSYPGKPVLKDFSYTFKRGERCGVVGPNGCGKSTLLRLLLGELRQQAGKISVGETVVFGYYSQDGLPETYNGRRVIDIVKEKSEWVRMADGHEWSASHFLSRFGFAYDTQYTFYEDLSGGQKRKLYLLMVLMRNPNFLVLDEPTNDFDIDTMNLLEDFLLHFPGCLLVVSHDRWFMDKIADHLFVFQGDGKVKDFYGNYSDYKAYRQQLEKGMQQLRKESAIPAAKPERKPDPKCLTYKERKEMESLEADIEALEEEKKQLDALFAAPDGDAERLNEALGRYPVLQGLLDEKSLRWLELSEKEA